MKLLDTIPVPADWEEQLQNILLQCSDSDKSGQVYICSPCRGATWTETKRNIFAARFYMYFAWLQTSNASLAPHAYLPLFLHDSIPKERKKALWIGRILLTICNELYVCGNRITEGMRGEIRDAARLELPIIAFNPDLLNEAIEIASESRGAPYPIHFTFDAKYANLSLSPEELFEEALGDA